MNLNNLIMGSDAIRYYRILEYDLIDFVKNHGLQPLSEIGEPIPPPYIRKIEVRRAHLTELKDEIAPLEKSKLIFEWAEDTNSGVAKSVAPFEPEKYEKIKAEISKVEGELSLLLHNFDDQSWRHLFIPSDTEGKKKLILKLGEFFYRPADIEKIIGSSVPAQNPLTIPAPENENNVEDMSPPEPMEPQQKRRLAMLIEQKRRFPKIIKAAVFATGYCIHARTKVTRAVLYDKLRAEFGDLITNENFEWIRSAIRDLFPECLQTAGHGKKVGQQDSDDE